MLALTVDFNATAGGLVRGLQEDAAGDEPSVGALVLLDDGEGSEAYGVIHEIRDRLIFADVDWDTLSPAGTIRLLPLPVPERGKQSALQVTGLLTLVAEGTSVPSRVEVTERRIPVPA